MIIKPYVYYPALVLCGIIGFGIGGNLGTQSIIKSTLKLCNEKPLECKFKYDIIKYQETGQVPYKEQKQEEKKK
jgi:hypothetical protein